jgi:uncharacterized SAM-binding protein YcdF (DUF218 family)
MMLLRSCRILGVLCVGLFLIFAFTPVPNLLYDWMAVPPRLGPAQAIVVLGSGVSEDGILDDESLRRAVQGIVLYRKGLGPKILFTGYTLPGGPAEAQVRGNLARQLGVPDEAVLVETRTRTTREEAALAARALQGEGIRRILLVTDAQHLVRARQLFARAGFEVLPAPAENPDRTATTPEGRLKLVRAIMGEALAQVYYRVAGYL